MLSKETIYTLYNVEGLLLLGSFIIGYNNNEWWLTAAFYVLLPLVVIVLLLSVISLGMHKDPASQSSLKRFFGFNFALLILLLMFVWWASGGLGV